MRIDWESLPARMKELPIDAQRHVPVPWFVAVVEGRFEFRAMDATKFVRAITEKRCWVCGQRLGAHLAFVAGPMCVVNRTSAEPPCHYDCAVWSAKNCPFLSRPPMVRREDAFTDSVVQGDAALQRNPGVAAVLVTRSYKPFKAPGSSSSGWLIEMGPPERVEWYCEGRPATREECEASIDSGMPLLESQIDREQWYDRPVAARALRAARERVIPLLPRA